MAQGPLIDNRLAAIDKQSNALAQVDIAIRDVLALYDSAVQQTNPYQVYLKQFRDIDYFRTKAMRQTWSMLNLKQPIKLLGSLPMLIIIQLRSSQQW